MKPNFSACLVLLLFAYAMPLFAQQKPELFILSVGVKTYSNPTYNLQYPDADARDVAAAFAAQTDLYDVVEVKTLTNNQATRANVRAALDDFKNKITPNDLFIFIFSGHGAKDYLLTHDFNRANMPSTALGRADLAEKIAALGCNTAMFLDACHSGSFAKSVGSKDVMESGWQIQTPEAVQLLVAELSATDKTNIVMASSSSDKVSFEWDDYRHGYFAQTLLNAFAGKGCTNSRNRTYMPDANSDGWVDLGELDTYMKEAVAINSKREESQQNVYSKLITGRIVPFIKPKNSQNPVPPVPTPTPDPRTTDWDGDGYSDTDDQCPQVKGTIKGCPDSDNDGVIDRFDQCPNQKGDANNNGCPPAAKPEPKPEPLVTKPTTTNDLPSHMVFVKGGTFTMGDVKNDNAETDETQHSVTVSDFYISKYETTFGEYDMFCNATGRAKPDDSGFGRGSRPVINVSWHDAVAYCDWKTQQTGKKYRLPTEAEWEFAARGRGANIRFGNNSDNINDQNANFDARADYKKDYSATGQYRGTTVAVTDIPAAENALGLRHMSGNVWEWCSDWYGSDYYKNSPQYDPQGAATGSRRVLRGGSWDSYPQRCRAATRDYYAPTYTDGNIGFRVACVSTP